MKRVNFKSSTNSNAMDVTINPTCVTFLSEDIDSDELVKVNLSIEDVKRLIKHLNKVVK